MEELNLNFEFIILIHVNSEAVVASITLEYCAWRGGVPMTISDAEIGLKLMTLHFSNLVSRYSAYNLTKGDNEKTLALPFDLVLR